MDDKTRNQFESLATLWKGAWEQFNERRKYEFQILISIWTALASFTALILSSEKVSFPKEVFIWSRNGLAAIFIVYVYGRVYLEKTNRKDFKIALHYERMLQKLSNSEFDVTLKKKLEKSKLVQKLPFLNWAPLFQIAITLIFCIAALLAVLYKSQS